MNNDYVIRMANQIADALGINPDRDQAIHDLADHLNRFWEPRMRASLLAVAGSVDAAARLSPLPKPSPACVRRPENGNRDGLGVSEHLRAILAGRPSRCALQTGCLPH
jgi:formate dehydrogenase subunit delta